MSWFGAWTGAACCEERKERGSINWRVESTPGPLRVVPTVAACARRTAQHTHAQQDLSSCAFAAHALTLHGKLAGLPSLAPVRARLAAPHPQCCDSERRGSRHLEDHGERQDRTSSVARERESNRARRAGAPEACYASILMCEACAIYASVGINVCVCMCTCVCACVCARACVCWQGLTLLRSAGLRLDCHQVDCTPQAAGALNVLVRKSISVNMVQYIASAQ